MAYEASKGSNGVLCFCGQRFDDVYTRNEHILIHFERKRCLECENELLCIGNAWYQLHDDISCNAIKVEPIDFNNGTAMADHLDLFVATEQDVKQELLDSLTFAGDIAEVDLSSIALDPLDQAPVPRIMRQSHCSFGKEQPKWRQYRCPKCNVEFANKSNVNRHKKMCTGTIKRRTHGQPRQYYCPYCQVRLANASNLNRHRKKCAVRLEEPCIAKLEPESPKSVLEEVEGNVEQESKTTTHPSHEDHMPIDSNALLENVTETEQEHYAEVKVPELILDAEPPSIATSATASEDGQSASKQFTCPMCSTAFSSASNVIRHKKVCLKQMSKQKERESSGKVKRYQCQYCGTKMADPSNIHRHRKRCFQKYELQKGAAEGNATGNGVGTVADDEKESQKAFFVQEEESKNVSMESRTEERPEKLAKVNAPESASAKATRPPIATTATAYADKKPKPKRFSCIFCPTTMADASNIIRHRKRCYQKTQLRQRQSTQVKLQRHTIDGSDEPTMTNDPLGVDKADQQKMDLPIADAAAIAADSSDESVQSTASNSCGKATANTEWARCPFCRRNCTRTSLSNAHKCDTAKYSETMAACGLCSRSFLWERNLHKHLRCMHGSDDHTMVKPATHTRYMWYCSLCLNTYSERKRLAYHIRAKHGADKSIGRPINDWQDPERPTHGLPVSCNYCWRTFDDRLALDAHKRESHREQLAQDGIKRCDLCPALFDLDGSRRLHSITVHGLNERRRVWECIVCGEPFTKVGTFVGHLGEHAPMANYVCCVDTCTDQFETIARLDEHLRNHTAPPVGKRKCDACEKTYSEVTFPDHRCQPANAMRMCDYCGKQYAASAFSAHLKTHRADCAYKCSVCPKEFRSSGGLRRHSLIHAQKRPCKCTVPGCDQAYVQHTDLYRHLYRAHGIYRRKIPCTQCDKVFPENSLLRKHMAEHL